jgi:hypothetical protein
MIWPLGDLKVTKRNFCAVCLLLYVQPALKKEEICMLLRRVVNKIA